MAADRQGALLLRAGPYGDSDAEGVARRESRHARHAGQSRRRDRDLVRGDRQDRVALDHCLGVGGGLRVPLLVVLDRLARAGQRVVVEVPAHTAQLSESRLKV